MTYEWRTWDGFWALEPSAEPIRAFTGIAFIQRMSNGRWRWCYYFPHSTSNRQNGEVWLKTRRGVQRWVEKSLAKFWEPPTITNPMIAP